MIDRHSSPPTPTPNAASMKTSKSFLHPGKDTSIKGRAAEGLLVTTTDGVVAVD